MAFEPDLLSAGMSDAPPPPAEPNTPIADTAKALTSGVVDATAQGVGGIAALAGAGPDSGIRQTQDLLNEVSQTIDKSISPAGQRAEGAQFVPGEGEQSIFKAPARSAVMKIARMTPQLLSALLLPEGWAGVAAGSTFFGMQGVAGQINDSRKQIMASTDDELKARSPVYQGLREDHTESEARELFMKSQNDAVTLLEAGVPNALAGGALSHALKAQAAKGLARSLGIGTADALAGGAVMGAGNEMARQNAETNAGMRDATDNDKIALSALNSGLTLAPLGGAAGAISGAGARRATRAERDKAKGTTVDPNGPNPAQTAAIDETLNPVADGAAAPASAPPGAPPGAPPAPDTLAGRIQAERERQAAAAKPPEEPPAATAPTVPPAPVPEPAPQASPTPAQEPPIPLPPTDRASYPPRRNPVIERNAVPLEDPEAPSVTPPGNLDADEVRAATETMPQKEEAAPAAAAPDPLADLNAAAKAAPEVVAAPSIATPTAALVDTTVPRKPRVLRTNPVTELVKSARQERAEADQREENRKATDAERKRQDRLTKVTLPNEAKAEKSVTSFHPEEGSDDAMDLHSTEQAALGAGGVPATDHAREALRARANAMVAAAENEGVRIPQRTTSSKERPEARNPTPYTSRLMELAKFDNLVKAAQRIEDPKQREAEMRRLYQDHIATERAIRGGDLEAAAERRIAANEALTAGHRKAELKRMMAEQARDAHEDRENSIAAEDIDESDARVTRKGKADHYAVDVVKGVRHSTVEAELGQLVHEFSGMKEPKLRARAELLSQIMRKISSRVGNTLMHFVHAADLKAQLGLGGGRNGFFRFAKAGAVGEHRGEIFVDNDVVHGVHGPHVILHEAIHVATNHAIAHSPGLADDIRSVAQHAEATYRKAGNDPTQQYAFDRSEAHPNGDPREFLAEALSNPELRNHMIETPAPDWMVKQWGLDQHVSLWRAFVSRIAKALGLGSQHVSLMDAALHHFDRAADFEPHRLEASLSDIRNMPMAAAASAIHLPTREQVTDAAPHYGASMRDRLRHLGLKLKMLNQVAEGGDHLFGEGKNATAVYKLVVKMAHEKQRILDSGAHDLVRRTAELQRKYTASGKFDDLATLMHDETVAGADAAKPLDQQKGVSTQGKAQHANLAGRYDVLPDDLKDHRAALHDYFRKTGDEASLATLKAIVRASNDGVPDDALAHRIFNKTLDDAEKAVVEKDGIFKAIQNARALRKTSGPYFPQMRHGDHVVSGTYKIDTPAGAQRINDEGKPDPKGNVFQFKTKAEAKNFAANATLHVMKEQHVFVDKATGERFGVEPDGTKVKLTKEDVASNIADDAYRVKLQDRHLEFFENGTHARQRYTELAKRNDLELDGVSPRKYEPTGPNATFLSHELDRTLNSLRQRAGFKEMDANQRREVEEHLRDSFLAALGPTRAQSRRLPRTNVAGASNDIYKGLTKYASSMSGFLARQKFMPQIDAAMKGLSDYNEAQKHEDTSRTYPRGQVLKEMQERLFKQGEPEPTSILHKGVSRLLQMSMLDKLASPAFHVINSMEPWTVSMPILAGRYGVGRTLAALNRAYRDIGAGTILKEGALNTGRAFRTDVPEANYLKPIYDRLKSAPDGKYLRGLLDEMHQMGVISKDAGMEIGRMTNPDAGLVGRGLDRADLMARQMGTAVESINRAVTGIAAYRLEFDKTKDHAKALDYAVQTTVNTMGDYSGANAPSAFNHPLGRLALQFKKYAQKTYYLLGKTAFAGLRGDPEAMKQFAGIMATHGLLAGALGLPLEAVKAGFLGANLLGATTTNYGDFEQYVRKQAAGLFGNAGGEIATRGLPRYLGVDLSTRLGLENMFLPLGDPKSMKTQDLLAYGAQAFAGAPISMLAEYPHGMQALMSGDMVEAARVLVPLKIFADSAQAYQRATIGKQTPSGRQSLSPYSPLEAGIKVLGFTPGRDAETGEMRAAVSGDQMRFKADRSKLVNAWQTATPNDKTAAWHDVQVWNQSQPKAAQITMAELGKGLQRRKSEGRNPNNADALRTTARDRHIRAGNSFYNLER